MATRTELAGARAEFVSFGLSGEARQVKQRPEVAWFGFEGKFVEPQLAEITVPRLHGGLLGGGGIAALNGGLIAAGFDAAFVLDGSVTPRPTWL